MRLKDIEPEEVGDAQRAFDGYKQALEKTRDFQAFLAANASVKEVLSEEEHGQVSALLSAIVARLGGRKWASFLQWKGVHLLNAWDEPSSARLHLRLQHQNHSVQ